jgi:hypothetical protein
MTNSTKDLWDPSVVAILSEFDVKSETHDVKAVAFMGLLSLPTPTFPFFICLPNFL